MRRALMLLNLCGREAVRHKLKNGLKTQKMYVGSKDSEKIDMSLLNTTQFFFLSNWCVKILKQHTDLYMIFPKNFFLNGNHMSMANIVCKSSFLFQVENKKCYWNCWLGPSNRPNQEIKLHPTSWQYPLINYLSWYQDNTIAVSWLLTAHHWKGSFIKCVY